MNCYLCNNEINQNDQLIVVENFAIYKCSRCSLVFTDTSLQKESLKKVNTDFYDLSYRENVLSRTEELVSRFQTRLKEIKAYKPNGGKVLDIGCGYGFFLESLLRDNCDFQCWELNGVEVSKPAADYSDKHYRNVFNGFLSEAHYQDKTFDVITFWDSLEHMPDPLSTLKEVYRILKDDGIIIFQAPNSDSYLARVLKEKWSWWSPPDHLWHFNPTSITRVFNNANFQVTSLKTWEPTQDFINMIYGTYFSHFRLQRFISPLIKTLLWPLIKTIQIGEKDRFGGLLLLIAKKIN